MEYRPGRRGFLTRMLLAATALPAALVGRAHARPARDFDYEYEVTRTEEEWRALLSDYEFAILRQSGTEWARSSPLWNDYRQGDFSCKGCDLQLYSSDWRVALDKGWVFFAHSLPTAVMTDIDPGNPYGLRREEGTAVVEVHCRRCGSHLGHLLVVEGQLVHCVNGTSLIFAPRTG
ncbi:peptide-methionine (R)-S-oxide reductase [Rhodobacteraceae bacterium 2CG4]|uniref:peptide-methionine (R)-S-oxide reductase n=1 Tax=Halovulum marinum TaxID=2662447 RepID=A0A6L5Z511_9RHOB|nr:peptide-methionine (R)-S-oxide reductase [Halovulum marinum]MSU91195.1 peptide-methionine (R)-S-oxide reductase [Halovulum marinum]